MPIKAVGSPLRILGIVVAWFATSAVSRTKQRRNRTGGSCGRGPRYLPGQAADRSAWSWRRKSPTWFQLMKVWLTKRRSSRGAVISFER